MKKRPGRPKKEAGYIAPSELREQKENGTCPQCLGIGETAIYWGGVDTGENEPCVWCRGSGTAPDPSEPIQPSQVSAGIIASVEGALAATSSAWGVRGAAAVVASCYNVMREHIQEINDIDGGREL